MYAIAVWDRQRQQLFLGRDRMGKKPLFYAHHDGRFLFGSEIKAILAAAPELAEPNPDAVYPYFRYGFIAEPNTMFRHVYKLPAAHWLRYRDGKVTIAPYWRLEFGNCDHRRSLANWREELNELLSESVRIRLQSEVPLGIFLSGGLDSSTIAAYAQQSGLRPLKTFTVGFDRPEWDESADARLVAEHLQTEHHELRLSEQDLVASLPETLVTLVRHFDEPFGDSSALPTYHVSRLARQHVTVILSGDGGDELFAGYSLYRGVRFAERYRQLPSWLRSRLLPGVAGVLADWLPAGRRYEAQRIHKVLLDSQMPLMEMYLSKVALCTPHLLRRLLPCHAPTDPAEELRGFPADILAVMNSNLPALSKASYADLRFRLLDDMLVKVDRMSMANSLEVRSPLLDQRLVEFAARMPPDLKLRRWESKAILRDTVGRYLPARTVRKRKQGFSVPLREWLKGGLGELAEGLLSPRGAATQVPWDPRVAAQILAEHRAGRADYHVAIWLLLNYAIWLDLYVH